MGVVSDREGGFEWWTPHDRALRRARALFLLGALVAAVYVIAPFSVFLFAWRDAIHFDARAVLAIVAGAVLVVVVIATVIAGVAWRGISRTAVALAGARPPTVDEQRVASAVLDRVALARGVASPTVWVIDDDAPNALVAGRAPRAHVCFTRGALALPTAELEALGAFTVAAICSRPFAYCSAAIDIVLFCESCTSVLWTFAVLVLVSAAVGVPPEIAAWATLCIAGLIVLTRLALLVADRALPRLLDDVTGLVDLEAIRTTEQPAPFGRLLARVRDDGDRVGTRWAIAHLWFDRDEVERTAARAAATSARRRPLLAWFWSWTSPPVLALRCERPAPHGTSRRATRVRRLSEHFVSGDRPPPDRR